MENMDVSSHYQPMPVGPASTEKAQPTKGMEPTDQEVITAIVDDILGSIEAEPLSEAESLTEHSFSQDSLLPNASTTDEIAQRTLQTAKEEQQVAPISINPQEMKVKNSIKLEENTAKRKTQMNRGKINIKQNLEKQVKIDKEIKETKTSLSSLKLKFRPKEKERLQAKLKYLNDTKNSLQRDLSSHRKENVNPTFKNISDKNTAAFGSNVILRKFHDNKDVEVLIDLGRMAVVKARDEGKENAVGLAKCVDGIEELTALCQEVSDIDLNNCYGITKGISSDDHDKRPLPNAPLTTEQRSLLEAAEAKLEVMLQDATALDAELTSSDPSPINITLVEVYKANVGRVLQEVRELLGKVEIKPSGKN